MANLTEYTNDELINTIVQLAVLYRERFNRSLGVTAEIGEYKTAQLLNLKLAKGGINRGFDAEDVNGSKVQIKTRVTSRTSQRTGLFNNFDFDYALLVLMSESYEVQHIYKADKGVIKQARCSKLYETNAAYREVYINR